MALLAAGVGVPESTNGLVELGFAPKLAVSVSGLPQIAGGAVMQNWPGAKPELSWYQIGVSVPCW